MEGRKKQSARQLGGGGGEDAEVGVMAQTPRLPHVPPLGIVSQQANTNDQAKPVIGWGIFDKNDNPPTGEGRWSSMSPRHQGHRMWSGPVSSFNEDGTLDGSPLCRVYVLVQLFIDNIFYHLMCLISLKIRM
jgi:hypothetical protein